MPAGMRSVLAVIAGLILFVLIVMTWQGTVMPRVYPLPTWVDMNDLESIKKGIAAMPDGAFAALLAGYALATTCAGMVAAAIGPRRPMLCAGIVGGLTMLGGVMNFATLPHPLWVVIVGVPMYMVAALVGGRLGMRLTR